MVRFGTALTLGRMLPRWTRDRVFEAAYNELLGEFLVGRRQAARFARIPMRAVFEMRAVGLVAECWRLLAVGRMRREHLPAGNAHPPNRSPRQGNLMESFVRDIKYSVRQLIKAPAFSATAILIVAVGIGANTAAFSIVNAMLFRPMPFANPSQLVDIYQDSDDGEPNSTSFPAYRDIAAYQDLFSGVAAIYAAQTRLQQGDALTPIQIEYTTSNYLDVLGLRPSIGRWFESTEDVAGGEAVAVLSYQAWQTKFAADPGILGTSVRMNGAPITVIGVGPAEYAGIVPLNTVDAFVSLSSLGPIQGSYSMATLEQRGDHWFFVKGRLRDGVTTEQTQAAMNILAARLEQEFPEHNTARDITVFGAGEVRVHPSVDAFLMPSAGALMVVVGLVLLVACSNLANLLLARASVRGKEISIRVAMGASRGQVARQLLTESVLLSLAGGAAGVLLASAAVRGLMAFELPLPIPLSVDLSLDVRVMAFAFFLSLVTGVAFGLAPAIKASRPGLALAMREETASLPQWKSRRITLRNTLVVAQVALSFVLMVAAGLFVRSLENAQKIDTGFSIEDVAFLQAGPSLAGYPEEDARNITDDFLSRTRALPGVEAAGISSVLPVTRRGTTSLVIDGYEPPSGQTSVEIAFSTVDAGYFRTLRIPLIHGRTFSDVDTGDGERVAIISETMATRFFGDADAVGKRFRSEGRPDSWVRVVGVVGDTTVRELTESSAPQMYRPWTQSAGSSGVVFVRTAGDPASLMAPMRVELQAIDAEIPVLRARTMEQHLSDSLSGPRSAAQFLAGFGFLALLLAGLGLYGIVSFAVGRRMVEVGVRMALGAQWGQVVWLVLRDVVLLVSVGIGGGIVLSLAATAGLSGLLYGVSPADPLTLAAVSAVMLAVGVGAAVLPAMRAAKADPVLALRQG